MSLFANGYRRSQKKRATGVHCEHLESRRLFAVTMLSVSESALPGDAIAIRGAGFGTSPMVALGVVNSSGVVAWQADQAPSAKSDEEVFASIPSTLSPGLYAVKVKNGAQESSVSYINRARITGLEFPEVSAGGSFRLFGRNLSLSGGTATVRFVDQSNGQSTAGTVQSGDGQVRTVVAAGTLQSGHTYTVDFSNGYGGSIGETAAPDPLPIRTGGTDIFTLGVPWGADFASFSGNVYNVTNDVRLALHALPNDGVDDAAAIQAAINAANTAGGGVVYLPSGSYDLKTWTGAAARQAALTMKSNVVLKGAGQAATTMLFSPTTPPNQGPGQTASMILWGGTSTTGVMDVTLRQTTQDQLYLYDNGPTNSKTFLLRTTVDFNQWGGGAWFNSSDRLLISGSTFKNPALDYAALRTFWSGGAVGASSVYIRNNTFPNMTSRLALGQSNLVAEGNTFTYDGNYQAALGLIQPVVGNQNCVALGSGRNIVMLNNTFNQVGSFLRQNDGEVILVEQPSNLSGWTIQQDVGTLTSTTSTTLSDSTKSWTVNSWTGYDLLLVSGTGVGQLRRVVSNTATTVTLDRAWDITPGATAHYALTYMNTPGLLIKGNVLQNKVNSSGIAIYLGARDIAIVGNQLTNSNGIWLRTEQSLASSEFRPIYGATVSDNVITSTDGKLPAHVTINAVHLDSSVFGVGVFDAEVRRNQLTSVAPAVAPADRTFANGYRVISSSADGTAFQDSPGVTSSAQPAIVGTLLDSNSAKNVDTGMAVSTEVKSTLISRMDVRGVDEAMRDGEFPAFLYGGASTGASGAGGNPTLGPTWVTGDSVLGSANSAVQFDGVDDRIDIGILRTAATITLEARVKTTSTGTLEIVSTSPLFFLYQGKLCVYENGVTVMTNETVNDGNWHHVAFSSDGTTTKLYIDGVLKKTSAHTRSGGVTQAFIGMQLGDQNYFAGSIDEVRVWNVVRGDANISTYANQRLTGTETGLVRDYRLDDGAGSLVWADTATARSTATTVVAGLVGRWATNEGIGATAGDSSGLGNAATLSGTSWTTGKLGKGLSFNGTSSYASIANSPSLQLAGAFSVGAWVKMDTFSSNWANNWRGIMSQGDPGAGTPNGWEVGTYSSAGNPAVGFYFRRAISGGAVSVYGSTNLVAGQWYHVAAVWDGVNMSRLYVDGVEVASTYNTLATAAVSSPILLGCRAPAQGGFFSGVMDDERVYNGVLSASAILDLAAGNQ